MRNFTRIASRGRGTSEVGLEQRSRRRREHSGRDRRFDDIDFNGDIIHGSNFVDANSEEPYFEHAATDIFSGTSSMGAQKTTTRI